MTFGFFGSGTVILLNDIKNVFGKTSEHICICTFPEVSKFYTMEIFDTFSTQLLYFVCDLEKF